MREAPTDVLIVLTNLPDRATAVKLAQMLIDKRLAACVNVLAEAGRERLLRNPKFRC
jgi:hypothetical protein